MKKVYTTSLLILGVFFLTHSRIIAQSGNISIGGGLIYGTGVFDGLSGNDVDFNNHLGIDVNGYYTITGDFRAGTDIKFFFPKEESGLKLTVWEINFNGNYLFYNQEGLNAYGLGGINITSIKTSIDGGQFGGFSGSTSKVGLNLGAGGEYATNFGALFTELKYVVSDADELVVSAGVRIPVN